MTTDKQLVENGRIDGDALARRIEAWIRHGEAVPADVTTYERWIVNTELRALVEECRVSTLPEPPRGANDGE